MGIGNRIKERRMFLNLTQPELAELVGVKKGTIGNYESNVSSPNEKILFKLFEVLKCDANFLYQDDMNLSSNSISITCTKLPSTEQKLLDDYRQLNDEGQDKASEYVSDLVATGRYIKNNQHEVHKKQA